MITDRSDKTEAFKKVLEQYNIEPQQVTAADLSLSVYHDGVWLLVQHEPGQIVNKAFGGKEQGHSRARIQFATQKLPLGEELLEKYSGGHGVFLPVLSDEEEEDWVACNLYKIDEKLKVKK